MNKITFCPHIIMDIPESTVEDIDGYIVSHFLDFMSAVDAERLAIYFSSTLMERFHDHYPWDKSSDEEWGGYVKQWHGLIMSKMTKVQLLEHEVIECDLKHSCASISQATKEVFNSFLEKIASHTLPCGGNEEAIFSPVDECNTHFDFISIEDFNDLKPAEFPWYKYYPRELPCEGEYPFIPPIDWRKSEQPKKGEGHGFVDINGREWVRDTLHKNHWDVQDVKKGAGRYRNVNDDGNIL
ncbi:polymorphic toxin type 17 domain-containing protein [Pantoea dispersa]|uniref:polymorphic toxin type 17 domain-containing protein n=1 Tax=Pantoea dispersa TaxID=59814 RepID=UPI0021C9DF37|nr:polymorphic toxin type 17 domain-containing protein [Pantoea dispersa]